jgi:hypothetical protein
VPVLDDALQRAADLIEAQIEGHEEPMSPEDQARWLSARTLADLGELTAQWLEGKIRSQPGYADPDPGEPWGPDSETAALIPVLAAANRAGYLTDCSQPGELPSTGYDGRTWQQRAAVSGFADDQVLGRLRRAADGTGLVLLARKAGHLPVSYRDAIPVTCADEEPCTWFGAVANRDGVGHTYDTCHPDAAEAACGAWQVAIIDLEWGRNDVLWPALERFGQASPGA